MKGEAESGRQKAEVESNKPRGGHHGRTVITVRQSARVTVGRRITRYYLRTLEDQRQKAIEEEKVVDDLPARSQGRSQNYVLCIKTRAPQQRPEPPILDQRLIDSLLADDAYNPPVRRALDAGLAVKPIQEDKAQLLERRKNMALFLKNTGEDQSAIIRASTEVARRLSRNHSDGIDHGFHRWARIRMLIGNQDKRTRHRLVLDVPYVLGRMVPPGDRSVCIRVICGSIA